MKALHPADPLTTVAGIPDFTSNPVVVQNYSQSYSVLNPSPALAGNWDFDIFFYPHPYLIGCLRTVDAIGAELFTPILNNQVVGANLAGKRGTWMSTSERYRLMYMGVTGYHNASALSNQGLLASAQYMATPSYVTSSDPVDTPGAVVPYARLLHELWADAPRTFEQMQNMPNAYLGPARDGVYAPYHLSEVCQDWVSSSDLVFAEGTNLQAGVFGQSAIYNFPPAPAGPCYPYGLEGTHKLGADLHLPYPIHRRADSGVIQISLRQLAPTAAFTFYFRAGWEMQILPGSSLTSFIHTSPTYDRTALEAYYMIVRELKDAYPADYNDLGKILEIIKKVGRAILPVAGLIPPLRPIAAIAAPMLEAIPDRPRDNGIGVSEPATDTMSGASKDRLAKTVTMPARLKLRSKRR